MKTYLSTLFIFAILAVGCADGEKGKDQTSADNGEIEACECLDIYTNGSEEERAQCDELRKDEAFQKAFLQCRAQSAEKKESLSVETPTSGRYQVIAEESQLMWTGQNITGFKHVGTVGVKRGQIEFDLNGIASATIIADMTQLDETNMEDEGKESKLIDHLKSDDFFNVEEYPEAKFVFTSQEDLGTGMNASGNFTVRGITQEEVAKVIVTKSGEEHVVITGTMIFDRTKYNVRYGSGKFFDNLGDDLIKDKITLKMKLKAKSITQPS